uniref:nuclear pore complex protein Nup107-like isoform X1 n=1 Tax=Myxine glutinosa TaxID=7769 RepID=UPI00358EE975
MEIPNVRGRPTTRQSTRHSRCTPQLDETPGSAPSPDLRSMLESSAVGFLQSPTLTKLVADSSLWDISKIIGSSARPSRLTQTPLLRTPLARFNETTQDEWLSKLELFTPDKSGPLMDVSTSQIKGENVTPGSLMLLDDDEDGVAASNSMYVEFLEILLMHPSSEVFELIEEYEAVCCKQLEMLKKRTTMSVRIQKKTMSVMWLLKQEMITWRLIRSLYSDRVQSALDDEAMAVDEFVAGPSEKRVMEAHFRREAFTRQSQVKMERCSVTCGM